MTSFVAWGPCADKVGGITTTEPAIDPFGREWRRRAYASCPSSAYRRVQARSPIHFHHRGDPVGVLEGLHYQDDGQLIAITSLDLDTDITDGGRVWYWSPTVVIRRSGILDLEEISLTEHPATCGLRPVSFRRGSLRSAHAWDVPRSVREMLEAAAQSDRDRDRPIEIRRTPQQVTAVRSREPDFVYPEHEPQLAIRTGPPCPILGVY